MNGSKKIMLTPREVQVLSLIERGNRNREIAAMLELSTLTIESYAKAAYRKLGVSSRTEAVFKAKSLRLLGSARKRESAALVSPASSTS